MNSSEMKILGNTILRPVHRNTLMQTSTVCTSILSMSPYGTIGLTARQGANIQIVGVSMQCEDDTK